LNFDFRFWGLQISNDCQAGGNEAEEPAEVESKNIEHQTLNSDKQNRDFADSASKIESGKTGAEGQGCRRSNRDADLGDVRIVDAKSQACTQAKECRGDDCRPGC
jgi:hypothetical protein